MFDDNPNPISILTKPFYKYSGLCFVAEHENYFLFSSIKKITNIKNDIYPGVNNQNLVVLHFYEGSDISGDYDIRIPLVMNIYDYMDMAFLDQRYMLFYDKMQKNLGITPPSDFRIKVLGVDLKLMVK